MGIETAAIAAFMAAAAPYLAAGSMAIGAGSAYMQYQAQQQQASAQQTANDKLAKNAETARNYQLQQTTTRALQERDAAGEKILDSRIQALEGEGAARARGAGMGVEGSTIEAVAREYWAKQGRAEDAVSRTANNTIRQLAAEDQGIQAQYEGRLQTATPPKEASLAALGLGIGSSVVNAGLQYSAAANPRTTRSS